MHRVKKLFTLIHIGVWTLFGLLVALQLSQENEHWRTMTLGFLLTCLYVFYSHFFLLTRYLGKNQKKAYFGKLAVIMLTGPFPFLIFHYRKLDTWDPFIEHYLMTLVTSVPMFVFLSWLARVTENLVINTIKKEQLEKQAVEAELYYLKSQINPHFLFNTLNNIHTLVYKQAPAAPEAVMRLASLMRYMIYESNAPTVPLSRELDYLNDYVGLQQLRYKNAPVVDMQVEGEIAACHIAPLLFIHLLENAYKHSPARLEPGDIKIKVEIQEDTLTFKVQNPIGNNRATGLEEPGGIGLPNVQKRLALMYPGKHVLEMGASDNTFNVLLKIEGIHSQAHEREADVLYH
ncbi:histidine kinase [Rufibacter radiotolerans]|uniref:Histidine kinase n=1 Tax=Rufibacter radiotolerans TaxID=1379910 RepID=A0A0H4VTQ0_9BACT|nr:sensor histidine kinase [Rufibacter radiotolerans]AKQ47179.1 histidine kinase [Rufibacter radiotolerans]